jgi:hypothetical protein
MKQPDLRTAILVLVVLMGCEGRRPPVPESSAGATNAFFQTWIGKWDGPEGTYLMLSKEFSPNDDKYLIEIRDLDGSKTFEGVSSPETAFYLLKTATRSRSTLAMANRRG